MEKWLPLIIVLVVTAGVLVALYFISKKLQKKQDEQQATLDSVAQQMTFFIIDKKKMKIKDSGLPKMVYEQTPKYLRWSKLPILKVKIGPKVMSLVCDNKIYDTLAPKQEVKATVSGIYVTAAKRIRGPIVETDPKKRKAQIKQEKKEAKAKAKANKAKQ